MEWGRAAIKWLRPPAITGADDGCSQVHRRGWGHVGSRGAVGLRRVHRMLRIRLHFVHCPATARQHSDDRLNLNEPAQARTIPLGDPMFALRNPRSGTSSPFQAALRISPA
jgi:hypothetical protein